MSEEGTSESRDQDMRREWGQRTRQGEEFKREKWKDGKRPL